MKNLSFKQANEKKLGILHHLDDDDHQCHLVQERKKSRKKTTNIRTTLDTLKGKKENRLHLGKKNTLFLSFVLRK